MLEKRTLIGFIVGSIIIGIGVLALFSSLGFKTVNEDKSLDIGESTSYQINANKGAMQQMTITGDKFDLKLTSPGGDPEIPLTHYTKEASIDWAHLEDGVTNIQIQNTGNSELHVKGTFQITTDPILFTYHFVVIISGIVIIGFSMGFTLRKPKGF